MAKVIEQTKTIQLFRKQNGQAIQIDLKLSAKYDWSPLVRAFWGEIYVEVSPGNDPTIKISSWEIKPHKAQLERFFGVKIDPKNNLQVRVADTAAYDHAMATWNAYLEQEKATWSALADQQPTCYAMYDFLDWGDYNITKHQDIVLYRKGLEQYEERPWVEVRRWNINTTPETSNDWKSDYEGAEQTGEKIGDNYTVPAEIATKWIGRHLEQIQAAATKANIEAAKKKQRAEESARARAEQRAEIEANEIMIFSTKEIYSRAGSHMLHSIGVMVGDEIAVYTTRYATDMERNGKPHTTTFNARQELHEIGYKWDANEKRWVAPYSEEKWAETLPIIQKCDTKYWPGDLGMQQCWECGTYHPHHKLKDDGGMPYCGC